MIGSVSAVIEAKARESVREGPRVTYLVKQLELVVRAAMESMTHMHGLTVLQFTALTVLQRHPGMSGAQLSRRSFVSPQAGSEMIAHLGRKGLVKREPDKRNRRVLRVSLTSEGERVVRAGERWMDQLEGRMLAGVSSAQARRLRQCLEVCVHNLS